MKLRFLALLSMLALISEGCAVFSRQRQPSSEAAVQKTEFVQECENEKTRQKLVVSVSPRRIQVLSEDGFVVFTLFDEKEKIACDETVDLGECEFKESSADFWFSCPKSRGTFYQYDASTAGLHCRGAKAIEGSFTKCRATRGESVIGR